MSNSPRRVVFRPRARLIRTIGDRLVSGPVAAIGELVKNGFDADAEQVHVKFSADRTQVNRIEIQDSGHGMLLETILEKWMEPATEAKLEARESQGGRKVLGSKGIGRFAAARLGSRMLLVSCAKRGTSVETTFVRVDWSKFDQGQYLDEVSVTTRVSRNRSTKTGTLIRVTGVPTEWQRLQFEELLKELRKFMSPLAGDAAADSFSMYLDVTECSPEIVGRDIWELSLDDEGHLNPIEVKPLPLFDAADYEISGTFDETGQFIGQMQFNGLSAHAPEHIRFKKALASDAGEAPCGKVRIKLMIFDRDPQSIDALIKRANLKNIGKREARHLLDDLCGVGIYRYGFRIRPYGDSDQDWLELDRRRVDDPSNKVGHNQIIGVVHVDDELKSNLVERSSREGLEDNGSFERLKSLLLTLLASQVEPLRRAARVHAGIGVKKPTTYSKIFESADFAWANPLVQQLPVRKQKAAKERIAKESSRLKVHLDELQQRQVQLEASFTLGQIVAEVVHTGRQPASAIGVHVSHVLEDWPLIVCENKKADPVIAGSKRSLDLIQIESKRLERLFRLLTPLSGRRRGRPVRVQIAPVVEGVIALYEDRLAEGHIDVSIDIDQKLHFVGYRDDLAMSVANLVENSIYWLNDAGVPDPKIAITSGDDQKSIWIDVADNGPGIDSRLVGQLFEPGFSTRVEGTGLGLSISREALARSRGAIELVQAAPSAVFRISFDRKDHKK